MTKKTSFWPYGIILFFGVIFSFNFWFLYQAVQSNRGLIEDNSYEKSLKYQDIIDLKQRSKDLGWTISYEYLNSKIVANLKKDSDEDLKYNKAYLELISLNEKGGAKLIKLNLDSSKHVTQLVFDETLKKGLWSLKIKLLFDDEIIFYDESQLFSE